MKKYFTGAWLVTTLMFIISITYFLWRIVDSSFRDNALGNLFATIMGIAAGVPIGLEINRVQQETQRVREEQQKQEEEETKEKQREKEQEEVLKANIESVYRELIENKGHLERLERALDQIDKPSDSAWEWLIAISDSFSSDAYYSLDKSTVDENRWRDLHLPLYIAYPITLLGLKHRIREGKAAYSFNLKHKRSRKGVSDELRFIKDLLREAIRRVIEAKKGVDTFRRQKRYIP